MRLRILIPLSLILLLVLSVAFGQRRRSRSYFDEEDNPAPIPADANEKTEFAFARLRYPSRYGRFRGGGPWATDYPKADRQYVQGVRRLTRLHTRSVEQVVDLDSDEIYKYPWIYAVEVGYWSLNDKHAAKLRDYLMRGGFLMVDDFHGSMEWEGFMDSMSRVFPNRPVVEIEDKDPVFHVIYDLDERFQVPGIQMLYTGRPFERDGVDAHWRGIYDDRGRLLVAICFNMDVGDAWEHADMPEYPERYASLAYRIGINFIVYSMSH